MLWRRRESLTQTAAAAKLGIKFGTLVHLECGGEHDDAPTVPVQAELTPSEQCFLLRKRSGRQIASVAVDIGVSRKWVQKMERDGAPIHRLLHYWAEQQSDDA